MPSSSASSDDARRKSLLRRLLMWVLGGFALLLAAVTAFTVIRIATFTDPGHEQVAKAGYVHKFAGVDGVKFSYVEGPDNGPPLVLLHAQLLDWYAYNRVLPRLAKRFHVFAIDYPGHGATVIPAGYPMTANRIGADLAKFIETEIGEPAFVTGNSSGGLLTLWLAANRPQFVRAALLEDPPLFASEYPEIKRTTAYRAFRTSKQALSDRPDDFLLYWIDGNARFFTKNIGPGTPQMLTAAVKLFRWTRPGEPIELSVGKSRTAQMILRGLSTYDPRFGAAFYDGTWNAGFDHAEALGKVGVPMLLLQANSEILPDGTLSGAMSIEQGERAASLLKTGQFLKVDASHVINLEAPDLFARSVETFFLDTER